jgi:hypothetical protein
MNVVLGFVPAWAMLADDPDDDVEQRRSLVAASDRQVVLRSGNIVRMTGGQLPLGEPDRLIPAEPVG